MIALTAGIALLIGWYRGFGVRSLELAAAAFAVVLAAQTVGLILTTLRSRFACRRADS